MSPGRYLEDLPNVTTDDKGRIRMTQEWTEKLWIEFTRDQELDSGIIEDDEDDGIYHEVH